MAQSLPSPERQDLSALVSQVIDELAVFSILAHQCLAQLKDRGVDAHSAVALKDGCDHLEGVLANHELLGGEVAGALGSLGLHNGGAGLDAGGYLQQE